jgi:ribosome biogenesis GTP-binding protein ylqF
MDMYQKRKIRAEKKNNDSQKSFSKVPISWFPGHMAKTRRQITEDLKMIDVVVEILDARIPNSSQNPDIRQITQNKKKIIILNKYDLADNAKTEKWIEYFNKKERKVVLADSLTGKGVNETTRQIQKIMEDEMQKMADKGRIGRKIRTMIVGIPNVGKSSFINRISKKTSAEVGNKPGVTKQKQWIRINEKIELLDTPGVLWPKFESQKVAMNLAITGTIKDDILDLVEVAYTLTKFMLENYKENLLQRYSLEEKKIDEILQQDQAENENIYEIMQLIGRRRGAILGGNIDDERTAKLILDDFRSGKLGKITLEIPE